MPTPTMTITTDSSLQGWGARMGTLKVRGLWVPTEDNKHINWLELKTVFLALKAFQKHLVGQMVLIQTENTTPIFYLNKRGNKVKPVVATGTRHLEVGDSLQNLSGGETPTRRGEHRSRQVEQASNSVPRMGIERELKQDVLNNIFHRWGKPEIDLFATAQNKKCPDFASPIKGECPVDKLARDICLRFSPPPRYR